MIERAWPYPILKPEGEWTEFDRDYIALLRTAHELGYDPRDKRSATLVFRGRRNGWEPLLGDGEWQLVTWS